MLQRIRSLWHELWFIEGPPHALALFRILMAIYWLVHWVPMAPHVRVQFSEEGMHFPMLIPPAEGYDAIGRFYAWLTQPVSTHLALVIYLVLLLSVVLILVGLFTRIALVVYVLLYSYYWMLHLHMLNSSFGRMTFIIMFFLIFSPCARAFSIDAIFARRRGAPEPEVFPLWTQRAICVQVFFIYVGTAIYKMHAESWNTGEVVFTALVGDWATPAGFWLTRFDWSWGVYDLVSLGTILFEMWAGLLLFSARWQKVIFVLGTLFHLQIAITLSIWHFLFMPLTYVLFVDPYRMRDALRRARWMPGGRARAEGA